MCFELQMMLLMLVGIFSDLSPLQTYNNISWTGAKTICMLRQDVLCLKRVDQILTLLCSFGKSLISRTTIGSTQRTKIENFQSHLLTLIYTRRIFSCKANFSPRMREKYAQKRRLENSQRICSEFAANLQRICSEIAAKLQRICSEFAANLQRISTIPTFSPRIFSPCKINQSEQQLKTADTNPTSEQERNTLSTTNLCRLLT